MMGRAMLVSALAFISVTPVLGAQASGGEAGRLPTPGTAFLTPERIRLQDGHTTEAERGILYLPAVRSGDGQDVVAVEFYRFRAEEPGSETAVPIFLMQGGPGFGGLSSSIGNRGFYERVVRPFTRQADLVVVGQRGFGVSRPYLRCGESEKPIFDDNVSYEDRMAAVAEASRTCRDYWEARGLIREAYNVRAAAADVADVARVLGYDRISMVGNSFGSHWALAVMRYHPELVARAVLGGVEGPDHSYDMPGHVVSALRRIASEAEASPELRDRVPEAGLIHALSTVVERLRENPVTVEVEGQKEENAELREVTLTHLIVQSVAEDGYSEPEDGSHDRSAWPADILRMYEGDYTGLAREALDEEIEGFDYIPSAAYFLYDCASGISRERREALESDPEADLLGRENWLYEGACPEWNVDLGEDFRTGFRTDVPTVMVHGTWDISTPIENVRELLPRFSDVRFIPVVRGDHGALFLGFPEGAEDRFRAFRDHLLRFAATGDTTALPDSLVLPPVSWKNPEP